MKPGPSGKPRPPGFILFLLRIILPRDDREFYLGDLQEGGRRPWFREVAGALSFRLGHLRRAPHPTISRSFRTMILDLWNELGHGARRLRRAPAASMTVVVALATGIGLSALMFSMISGGILPTLPFPDGDRMVRVHREGFAPLSAEAFRYWRERQQSFEGLAAWTEQSVNLTIDGRGSGTASSAAVEPSLLTLLAVQPLLGRGFTDADAVPGAADIVLIGHELWRTRMDADPDVLGRTVRVNGTPARIIGVMPEGFGFPWSQELWTPLDVEGFASGRHPGDLPGPSDLAGVSDLSGLGLLREGVSARAASAELTALEGQRPRPADRLLPPPPAVRAFTDIMSSPGQSQVLAALLLGVGFMVLLVACANAANVLLARAAVRAPEMAIRTALGASRRRVAALFWAEVATLALAGAAGGVLLAAFGVARVRGSIPPGSGMPFWIDLRIDLSVLAFVAAAAAVAAGLGGIAPALYASRANQHDLLKDTSRGSSSRSLGRTMGRLIGVEIAVSFVLLVAAGLFIRSAVNLQGYSFAFDAQGVYTGHVQFPEDGSPLAGPAPGLARAARIERLEERLAALPGATAATLATALPGVGAPRRFVAVEGVHEPSDADLPRALFVAATPGFFDAFRVRVMAGRAFDARDGFGELPVAVVNAAFQDRYLPGDAVGHRVALPTPEGHVEWRTVIGVVGDALAGGLAPELEEAVYVPLAQAVPSGVQVAVRTSGSASDMAGPVREAVAAVGPDLGLYWTRPLVDSIRAANAQHIWLSALFLVAGGLALFLALIGLYGIMAFWVAHRTREIGVRMAMGGGRGAIVRFVLGQGIRQMAAGLAAGGALALPVAWWLRGALLEVRPFDPLVFGTVLGVLAVAGVLGCIVPTLMATGVDPQVALRAE